MASILSKTEIDDIEYKVSKMKAMEEQLLDHRDLFFDLSSFASYAEKLMLEIKYYNSDIESELHKRKLLNYKDRINIGFKYFDLAIIQRQIGSYSEIFDGSRVEAEFPCGFQSIIKAVNYICFKTLQNTCKKNWNGFVVFVFLKETLSAASSIIVVNHGIVTGMDFAHEWFNLGHELGHIYYWDMDISARFIDYKNYEISEGSTLVEEIFADIYCYENSYRGDVNKCIIGLAQELLNNVRSGTTRYIQRYHIYRLLSIWVYGILDHSEGFKKYFRTFINKKYLFYFKNKRSVIRFLSDALANSKKIDLNLKIIQKQVVEFLIEDLNSYDKNKRLANDVKKILCLIGLISQSNDNNLFPKRENIICSEMSEYKIFYPKLLRGEVIFNKINNPFVFLKGLTEYCKQEDTDLDAGENSHIRGALILTFANNYMRIKNDIEGME
jgi:hypothetical protein